MKTKEWRQLETIQKFENGGDDIVDDTQSISTGESATFPDSEDEENSEKSPTARSPITPALPASLNHIHSASLNHIHSNFDEDEDKKNKKSISLISYIRPSPEEKKAKELKKEWTNKYEDVLKKLIEEESKKSNKVGFLAFKPQIDIKPLENEASRAVHKEISKSEGVVQTFEGLPDKITIEEGVEIAVTTNDSNLPQIEFPEELKGSNNEPFKGVVSLSIAFVDDKGENMPEDKAVYFGVTYIDGKLADMHHPAWNKESNPPSV
nr:hypothetical protein [Rickettsiaceae bacterium]